MQTEVKNSERYYVYGAWWKSTEEVQFYLDGRHVYSIQPKIAWDVPAYIQMAIETYDWNPLPADGGLVETGTWDQRTTQYDWVRTWELADIDYNIYYCLADPDLGKAMLEKQQGDGVDAHSLAVDPLFVDPANGDFRFKPESPALKMGIVPIDLSEIGLRK